MVRAGGKTSSTGLGFIIIDNSESFKTVYHVHPAGKEPSWEDPHFYPFLLIHTFFPLKSGGF